MEYSREIIIDCLDKLDGISDYDSWEDILDKHSLDISPSHIRKMAYGFRAYRDAFSNGNVDEFDEKLLKLNKEKIKLRDLRTHTNKKIRELARVENVVDLIKEEIDQLSIEKPMINDELKLSEPSGKDAILCLGDWHYAMNVYNSVNEYNVDICKRRVNEVIDKAIENGLKENIDKLHVCLLGDMISGNIHTSISLQNQEGVVEQIINVSELISEAINKLSNHFYVTVTSVTDNHSRVDMIKDNNLNKENYAILIKQFVKLRLKDNVNVVVLDNTINDDEIGILRVKNMNVLCCHGDKINKSKCDNQLRNITGVNPDVILLAHFHSPEMFNLYSTEVYVNSSLVSSDEYAISKKLYSPPSQLMLIVDDNGVCVSYILKVK